MRVARWTLCPVINRVRYFLPEHRLIVAVAFQTDITRVVTFCTGSEGRGPAIPERGIRQERHALSHYNGNPTLMADLATSDRLSHERSREGPPRAGRAWMKRLFREQTAF